MSATATVIQERIFFIRQRAQRGSGCEACGHSGLIDGYACLMCRSVSIAARISVVTD